MAFDAPGEDFSGGVNTAQDPALLPPGVLQRANNCIYRPLSPGLWKAPNRATYGTVDTGTVKGLRGAAFDGVENNVSGRRLIAYIGTTYYISTFAAETGTFASLDTGVGNGATLESIHYANRHYLLNGNTSATPNRVLLVDSETGSLIVQRHGLAPVVVAPTVASAAGAGWPDTSDFGDGRYFFFVTEVINFGTTNEYESAFEGTPPSLQITGTADGVTVTFPTSKTNTSATHWRIYVVGPKDPTEWDRAYLVDAQAVATVGIGVATYTLGGSSLASQTNLPTNVVSSAWTSGTNILTDNNTDATTPFNGTTIVVNTFGFNTGAITSTVRGIEVEAKIRHLTNQLGTLRVEVSNDAGVTWYPTLLRRTLGRRGPDAGFLSAGNPFDYSLYYAGGQSDLFGRASWAAADFSNANFRLRITAPNSPGADTTQRLGVDFVKVRVYYGTGDEIQKGAFYPVVVAQFGPAISVSSANGPPPVASTGDIFQGQMLLNDVTAPRLVRASVPDNPEAFPDVYYLAFEEDDTIRFIRRLRNKVMVGMDNHLFRVDFFPRAEDPEFDRGRPYSPVSDKHGIPGTHCGTIFTPPNGVELLAYVNAIGLFVTDSQTPRALTTALDWPNTVNVSRVANFILVDSPELYSLLLFYIPADDTTSTVPTHYLQFCYHPNHITEAGELKPCGPVALGAASADVVSLSNRPILLTGGTDTVRVEDRGIGTLDPDVVTREVYPAGMGNEGELLKLYLRHLTHNPYLDVLVDVFVKNTREDYDDWSAGPVGFSESFRNNKGGAVPGGLSTLVNNGGLIQLPLNVNAESFALRLRGRKIEDQGNANLSLVKWGIEGRSLGRSDKQNA